MPKLEELSLHGSIYGEVFSTFAENHPTVRKVKFDRWGVVCEHFPLLEEVVISLTDVFRITHNPGGEGSTTM